MKLRLAPNSVRLRVLRSEVDALRSGKRLQVTVEFGPDEKSQLTYALQQDDDTEHPNVRFLANEILVSIPAERMLQWTSSEEVGIYAQCVTGAGAAISLLVEKDFACLDRSEVENADTFANPNLSC